MKGNYKTEVFEGLIGTFKEIELIPLAPYEEIEIIILAKTNANNQLEHQKSIFILEFVSLPVPKIY